MTKIESHPKKVVVVVFVVAVVAVIILGQRNLTLKLGQNWVNVDLNQVIIAEMCWCCFLLFLFCCFCFYSGCCSFCVYCYYAKVS